VAASFYSSVDRAYGVCWHDDTVYDLRTSASSLAIPYGINDSVEVTLGSDYFYKGTSVSYLWRAGQFTKLLYDGDTSNYMPYINNHGDIVGTKGALGNPETINSSAIVWIGQNADWLGTYTTQVGDTAYSPRSVKAINDNGYIAGKAEAYSRTIVTAPRFPVAYLLVPSKSAVVMPVRGRVRVTLVKASASLISDIYMKRPSEALLIANNLVNVGKVVDTTFEQGTTLEFGILVHGPKGTYEHLSNSKYAKIDAVSDRDWTISFEDLPDSIADWDFNDVVIRVEVMNPTGVESSRMAGASGTASLAIEASGQRTIVTSPLGIGKVSLVDMAGREVAGIAGYGRGTVEMDMRLIPKGTYIVRVTTAEGVETRRVIRH
jgi:hypothetical protein